MEAESATGLRRVNPLWLAAVSVPVAGFVLLLAAPDLDVHWQHDPSHFWLVVGAAAITAALAFATGDAAEQRGDPRLQLVSLAFFVSAGFLGLHALATPGIFLEASNLGFLIAAKVGLFIAAPLAALSAIRLDARRASTVLRRSKRWRLALGGLMLAWAIATVAGLPPLADEATVERATGAVAIPAILGAGLYLIAAWRYMALGGERSSLLPIAVAAGFVLLAEALLATAFARDWHATWWLWHALILAAFGIVAYAARREWREERFSALYTDQTAAGKREVTIVFADLSGFTTFSEGRDPRQVSEMLNAYFEIAIPPIVREHGGEIDRLIGDAVMATFNVRGDQPDHAERAARAAREICDRTAKLGEEHPDWPRFRIGVNTGEAVAGVLGAAGGKSYTVIGDAVNVASRLESEAPVGGVVIGEETMRRLPEPRVEWMGEIRVKGKREPVRAYVLSDL